MGKKTCPLKISSITLFYGFLLLTIPPLVTAGDIEIVKTNIINFYTAAGKDRTDPMVAAELNAINTSAQTYMNSMLSDGRWSDINYGDISWGATYHYQRLWTMTQAYKTSGLSLYGNATLRTKIEKGLAYILKHVYSGCPTPGNWYEWQVRIPASIGRNLILMQGSIDPGIFQKNAAALDYLVPSNYASYATAANMTWIATGDFYYAVISNNLTAAQTARNNMASTCSLVPLGTEGVQTDYSFHQHNGNQLYTGGYGGGWAVTLCNFIVFTEGTSSLQLSSSQKSVLASFVNEGLRWGLFHNYFDRSIIGRGVASHAVSNTNDIPNVYSGLYAMLSLSNMSGTYQSNFISASKKVLETWPALLSVPSIAALASAAKKSSTPAAWPSGHKHFNVSDYTIHRNSSFFASVRMISNRIRSAESVSGDNLKSWYIADGLTYIVMKGNEYMADNVLPTLDWARQPGTTVEQKPRANEEGYGKGSLSFVGGVTVGNYGASAMDFKANTANLTAKKSWFFFDQEVVCLGSNITCPSTYKTETTVNQWPLSSASTALTVNGTQKPSTLGWSETMTGVNWAHCDAMGYYFPTAQTLIGKRENRSGKWSDIGTGPTTVYSHPIFTLYYDHGANASNASYSYAIVPGKTASQMQSYAASKPFTVLVQNNSMHAVKHNALNAVGVVFWQAGAVDYIEADKPCIAFYQKSGTVLTLAVADPTHNTSTIKIKYKGKLSPSSLDSGVSSTLQGEDTVITFNVSNGKNYVGRFNVQSSVARQYPWEGAGMTAGWFDRTNNILTIISKDRFWHLDTQDMGWIDSGRCADQASNSVWKLAPKVDGLYPWEGTYGITTGWVNPDNYKYIVSKDRYWVMNPNGVWTGSGKWADRTDWPKNLPLVDGLRPWEGSYGITAGWYNSYTGILMLISKDRYWEVRWSDRVCVASGKLANHAAWKLAPKYNGLYPWEGTNGVTAGWYKDTSNMITVVSKDVYWMMSGVSNAWTMSPARYADEPASNVWKNSPLGAMGFFGETLNEPEAAPQADPTFQLGEFYSFPNPAREGKRPTLHVEMGLADSAEVRIYDISGGLVHEAVLKDPPTIVDDGQGPQYAYEYPWDISGVPSGTYICVVRGVKEGAPDLKKTFKLSVVK